MLHAERDSLALGVDLEDLDLDGVVDLDDLARVRDPAPAHVRDVAQPVDPAEVNEGTEVGEVLDDALDDRAFVKTLEELLLLGLALLF